MQPGQELIDDMGDAPGTLQSESEYDGYGIYNSIVGSPQTDFGYVGSKSYVTDPESGLLELGQRYYLPVIGRFLTQDPVGQQSDLNLYAYCHDDPITNVDPSGKGPELLVVVYFVPGAGEVALGVTALAALGAGIYFGAQAINHAHSASLAVSQASRVRRQNYPHSFPRATRQQVIDANTRDGQVIDPATDKPIDPDNISIEHKRPVVDHWNEEGNNQTREERNQWHNDPENLTVKPNRGPDGNSQQGGRTTQRYDPATGPNYSR
jgi:RHS repeat-associated protein